MNQKLFSRTTNILRQSFQRKFAESNHNFSPGSKAPTLSLATIPITVETFEGRFFRIHAEVGKSLWDQLKLNDINIGGYCGGGNQDSMRDKRISNQMFGNECGLCYCTIDQPWFDKLRQAHDFEKKNYFAIIESVPDNTRFACSIEVEQWMKEMIVRVPTFRDENFTILSDNSGLDY